MLTYISLLITDHDNHNHLHQSYPLLACGTTACRAIEQPFNVSCQPSQTYSMHASYGYHSCYSSAGLYAIAGYVNKHSRHCTTELMSVYKVT